MEPLEIVIPLIVAAAASALSTPLVVRLALALRVVDQPNPRKVNMRPNIPLMGGYCLYGLSTVLLVLALRGGELSILYPIISLTYVWVTTLSVVFLKESLNPFKVVGLSVIVLGVAVLGMDRRK